MADSKPGLFSSFTLSRASKSPRGSETLAHPLLGASTSSLNLSSPAVSDGNAAANASGANENSASGSGSGAGQAGGASLSSPKVPQPAGRSTSSTYVTTASGSGSVGIDNLPYKPRQRHGHTASTSSVTTITSPPVTAVSTSPTTAVTASAAAALPATSTSATTTFALPPSATDDLLPGDGIAGPSSASSGTLSSILGSGPGSATSRLQLQSIKASAQRIGLGNGSLGMNMLDTVFEKVVQGRKGGEGEWGEVLKVLSGGKAVLLLPTTSSNNLPITPLTLRDHIVFISPPAPISLEDIRLRSTDRISQKGKESAEFVSVLVTLSGMVGTFKGSEIQFESILDPSSRLAACLKDPAQRGSVLSHLRPTSLSSTEASFPSYPLSDEPTTLGFPPIGKGLGISLDGAPGKADKIAGAKLGRINPFASFFGGRGAASAAAASKEDTADKEKEASNLTPERPISPRPSERALSPTPSSPRPSLLTTDQTDAASIRSDGSVHSFTPTISAPEGFNISAYTISKPIKITEVHKSLGKALRSHIRSELGRLPEKVVDRVIKLVSLAILPPSAVSGSAEEMLKTKEDTVLAIDFSKPAVASERLQDVIEGVYDDLLAHFRHDSSLFVAEGGLRRKVSGGAGKTWGMSSEISTVDDGAQGQSPTHSQAKEERRRRREERAEKEASEGTERVEAVITRLLYNGLFSPLDSDDVKHDEALASRIAALNMLELSLDHLGLITQPEEEEVPGQVAAGLAKIVEAIGEELQKLSLSTCLTPKEKADILISAHQLVVDGLSDLPQVELRPEGEQYKPPSQSASVEATPRVDQDSRIPDVIAPEDVFVDNSTPIPDDQAEENEAERTPHVLKGSEPTAVPELVLTKEDSPDDVRSQAEIEQAMSDSVLTLSAQPLSRDASKQSKASSGKSAKKGTSGADLILPIIIYAVVQSNPPRLASHLMYLRRYRSAICLAGEASYAMVNLTAVVEFLEHVDLAELGLGGESDKVMSIADLSPIGLDYLNETDSADAQSIASASSRLRGRVFQVGELAGSAAGNANKVITGVVESSWTAVRGLMSPPDGKDTAAAAGQVPAPVRPVRPRQTSTFSLASVTASVANIAAAAAATTAAARSRANSRASEQVHVQQWQGNQEMIDVAGSRPQSIREKEDDDQADQSDHDSDTELGHHQEEEDDLVMRTRSLSDARSIRSVGSGKSNLITRVDSRRDDAAKAERVSLSDRLASIGGFGRAGSGTDLTQHSHTPSPSKEPTALPKQSGPSTFLANFSGRSASTANQGHARRSSLLSGVPDIVNRLRSDSNPSPAPSTSPLPPTSPSQQIFRLRSGSGSGSLLGATSPAHAVHGPPPRPVERFMSCDLGDLKLSEVGELLRDYRRLANYVTSLEGGSTGSGVASPERRA